MYTLARDIMSASMTCILPLLAIAVVTFPASNRILPVLSIIEQEVPTSETVIAASV